MRTSVQDGKVHLSGKRRLCQRDGPVQQRAVGVRIGGAAGYAVIPHAVARIVEEDTLEAVIRLDRPAACTGHRRQTVAGKFQPTGFGGSTVFGLHPVETIESREGRAVRYRIIGYRSTAGEALPAWSNAISVGASATNVSSTPSAILIGPSNRVAPGMLWIAAASAANRLALAK